MIMHFRKTFTRPSSSVPFYADAAEFTQYITATYVDTGKCMSWRAVTDSPTTRVTESIWVSQEDINSALLDAKIIANDDLTRQYCEDNLISISFVIEKPAV